MRSALPWISRANSSRKLFDSWKQLSGGIAAGFLFFLTPRMPAFSTFFSSGAMYAQFRYVIRWGIEIREALQLSIHKYTMKIVQVSTGIFTSCAAGDGATPVY